MLHTTIPFEVFQHGTFVVTGHSLAVAIPVMSNQSLLRMFCLESGSHVIDITTSQELLYGFSGRPNTLSGADAASCTPLRLLVETIETFIRPQLSAVSTGTAIDLRLFLAARLWSSVHCAPLPVPSSASQCDEVLDVFCDFWASCIDALKLQSSPEPIKTHNASIISQLELLERLCAFLHGYVALIPADMRSYSSIACCPSSGVFHR